MRSKCILSTNYHRYDAPSGIFLSTIEDYYYVSSSYLLRNEHISVERSIYIHIYVYRHIYTCIFIYIFIFVHMYMCIYMYIPGVVPYTADRQSRAITIV